MAVDFNPSLGQGFVLSVSIDSGTSYIPIAGVSAPGKVSVKKIEVDVTPIDYTSPKYMAGMSGGEQKTITFMRDPNDPGQNQLIASIGTNVWLKHDYTTGETITHEFTLSGMEDDDPKKNQANMMSINGRINGEPVRS